MTISPKRAAGFLCLIVIVLTLLHLATQALRIYGGHERQLGFQHQFNLNEENNIPTWFSSSMLLVCSLLLGLIGWAKRGTKAPDTGRWLALAAIFLFLSMDEASSLHEMTMEPTREFLKRTGLLNPYLFYSWLPFGITAVAIIGLYYLAFLRTLPKDVSRTFLLAGCVFISGAVITEMHGSAMHYLRGADDMPYAVVVATEEALEMFGIVAFLYGLLVYLLREDISTAVVQRLQHLFSGARNASHLPDSRGNK